MTDSSPYKDNHLVFDVGEVGIGIVVAIRDVSALRIQMERCIHLCGRHSANEIDWSELAED